MPGRTVVVLYWEVSKAFLTIPHNILVSEIGYYSQQG